MSSDDQLNAPERQWLSVAFIIGLATVFSSNLPGIWAADVYARGAGIIFLLWLVPAIVVCIGDWRRNAWRMDAGLLWLSLALCLVGVVGSLNIARHLALAFALAGATRSAPRKLVWLVGAFSWLPATGWLARDIPGNGLPLRIVILAFGLILSIPWWRRAAQ